MSDVLAALLRANIAGGLAVLLVLALRGGVCRAFGAGAVYGLWLIPPLAMAASLIPIPLPGAPPTLTLPNVAPAQGEPAAAATSSIPWLMLLWLAGLIVSIVIVVIRQHRFMTALGKPQLDIDGLPILRARDGFAVGPAVIGTLAPRIVLPHDFDQRYSADERRVILAHERVHLFGHDVQANALAALLQCICWFNPLAHIAAYFYRIDQELNADAEVVRQYPDLQRTYAEALLKTQIASRALILGCQWPARSEHPLKRRIALLAIGPAQLRRAGGAAVASLALATGLAAWAATPHAIPTAQPVVMWAMVKPETGGPQPARRILASEGAWTELTYEFGATRYRVRLNPVRHAGHVEVRSRIETNGVETEPAPLILDSAEPGLIRLGRSSLLITVGDRP